MTRRLLILATVLLLGCDRRDPAPPATRPSPPTIASTVPSVTDLIVGMGAADRLVAISTYDRGRPDVGRLPVAGDYQTTDWEQLAAVRPSVLVTFVAPDRQLAGVRQRAADLHVTLLNLPVDRLDQLDPAVTTLGAALGEPALAAAAVAKLDAKLAAVARRAAGRPGVSALLVIGADATMVAGPGTYLDDLLARAGGTNAAASLGTGWRKLDRETLVSLHPAVVLQLMPDAKPAELAQARATWAQLPAGTVGRVCPITDAYATQPGWHLPDLAERFAQCLHPDLPTSRPADR